MVDHMPFGASIAKLRASLSDALGELSFSPLIRRELDQEFFSKWRHRKAVP